MLRPSGPRAEASRWNSRRCARRSSRWPPSAGSCGSGSRLATRLAPCGFSAWTASATGPPRSCASSRRSNSWSARGCGRRWGGTWPRWRRTGGGRWRSSGPSTAASSRSCAWPWTRRRAAGSGSARTLTRPATGTLRGRTRACGCSSSCLARSRRPPTSPPASAGPRPASPRSRPRPRPRSCCQRAALRGAWRAPSRRRGC
mmetsp:Transcript_11492/g.30862  ORF Transcript_11492/g.30862 Transcript_11492/m.30862 type:complete len:201 (-) Transcript_11492:363-965(-)